MHRFPIHDPPAHPYTAIPLRVLKGTPISFAPPSNCFLCLFSKTFQDPCLIHTEAVWRNVFRLHDSNLPRGRTACEVTPLENL